jgi:hypothetical protein
MSKRPPLFRATDLARALRAGAMAGVNVYVSIAKTGELTVSPMPTNSPPPAPQTSEWDRDLGKPPA